MQPDETQSGNAASAAWGLVRVKREWVPDWLWRCFCFGNLATFTPWKELLTRRQRDV